MEYKSFVCIQLNGFKYDYLSAIDLQPTPSSAFKIK